MSFGFMSLASRHASRLLASPMTLKSVPGTSALLCPHHPSEIRELSFCLLVKWQHSKNVSIQFQSHENLSKSTSLFTSLFIVGLDKCSLFKAFVWFQCYILLRILTFCSNIMSHLNIKKYLEFFQFLFQLTLMGNLRNTGLCSVNQYYQWPKTHGANGTQGVELAALCWRRCVI